MHAPTSLNTLPSARPSVLTAIIAALVASADILRHHGRSGDKRMSKTKYEFSQTSSIGPRRKKPRHHRMDKGELRNALGELQCLLHIHNRNREVQR